MADKFSRFLNLERTRSQAPVGTGGITDSGRFDALESPADAAARAAAVEAPGEAAGFAPQPPAPTPGEVAAEAARAAHFGPSGPPLELEQARPEDQPFVRCARCQADNSPFAQSCQFCGSDFNTPAQRAFNERLWAQRREEAEREAQALSQFQQQRAQALSQFQQQRAQADVDSVRARQQAALSMADQMLLASRTQTAEEERPGPLAINVGGRRLVGWKAILAAAAFVVLVVLLIIPATRRFLLALAFVVVAAFLRGSRRRGRHFGRHW